jgi:hypothetical protein
MRDENGTPTGKNCRLGPDDDGRRGLNLKTARLSPVPCETNADLDKHGRSTDGQKGRQVHAVCKLAQARDRHHDHGEE